MEYNLGDKIIINSLKWYNKNKRPTGDVEVPCKFLKSMSIYCGKTATITDKRSYGLAYDRITFYYSIDLDNGSCAWSKEMFVSLKQQRKQKLKKINDQRIS
jgi:hypothetical protein